MRDGATPVLFGVIDQTPAGSTTSCTRASRVSRSFPARFESRRAASYSSTAMRSATWITPLGEGEMRVPLTFEYVTDVRMLPVAGG